MRADLSRVGSQIFSNEYPTLFARFELRDIARCAAGGYAKIDARKAVWIGPFKI
jgi:hypothetical protein